MEVLSVIDSIPRERLEKSLIWTMNMQYNEENSYFIPKEWQAICHGGLRHDYFNQEIWIDSLGHMLIVYANY